jgi:thiol:disulfide interchange protein DsbA
VTRSHRRRTLAALAAGATLPAWLVGAPARAQPGATQEGYRLLASPQPAPALRIEVLEFFYFGCPFCRELDSRLASWLKTLPDDVVFDRRPVIGRDSWAPLARLHYALLATGQSARLHGRVYDAVQAERLPLGELDAAAAWFEREGGEPARLRAAWQSAEVDARVKQARVDTDAYDIQATPSLVVDGRWLTSSGLTRGVPGVLPMADRLIDLARTERARAGATMRPAR